MAAKKPEFNEILERRCSIRKYSTKKVSLSQVYEIAEAAKFAPCAGNHFTVNLVIVSDKKKKAELAEAALEQYFIANATYIIVVCSNTSNLSKSYGEQAEKYCKQQAGAAIENMLLKVTELGLASCWVGAFDEEKVRTILNIPDDIYVEALLPIGNCMPGKHAQAKKPDLKLIAFFEKWGQAIAKPPRHVPAF